VLAEQLQAQVCPVLQPPLGPSMRVLLDSFPHGGEHRGDAVAMIARD
jgi:hypothetical protein